MSEDASRQVDFLDSQLRAVHCVHSERGLHARHRGKKSDPRRERIFWWLLRRWGLLSGCWGLLDGCWGLLDGCWGLLDGCWGLLAGVGVSWRVLGSPGRVLGSLSGRLLLRVRGLGASSAGGFGASAAGFFSQLANAKAMMRAREKGTSASRREV